jgi:hypothetical protein
MKSRRPAQILAVIMTLGMPAAAHAQATQSQSPLGFLADPNALGKALDGLGRAEGLEKPLPCPPDASGNTPSRCPQGLTPDQLKMLGLFGIFTQFFDEPGYGYGIGPRRGFTGYGDMPPP